MDLPDNIAVDENLTLEKTDVCQVVPAGNTETAGKVKKTKRENAAYRWFFTLNSHYKNFDGKVVPIVPEKLAKILGEFCKEFYFQLESGEQTGYEHYQGCFSLKIKHRRAEVKNLIGIDSVHVEHVKNWFSSIKYCGKSDTRIKGPWDHKYIWINTIPEEKWPWWYRDVFDILKTEPDFRTIYWLWSRAGNIGKTSFCKYALVHLNACVLGNGSFTDLAFAIDPTKKIVLFNITRTIEGRVNYTALEAIKDGLVFSGKYESSTKAFNCPHVVIFANFEPDLSTMSMDRWQIINLDT